MSLSLTPTTPASRIARTPARAADDEPKVIVTVSLPALPTATVEYQPVQRTVFVLGPPDICVQVFPRVSAMVGADPAT